ncbi:MAG TPA: hypothetical protein VGH73_04880 [Thermoanaerobaculia bacterium]|jgi:hypothetical protein
MAFWGKTAVRALFGLVDGVGYAMRSTVIEMAQELGVELSDRDKLKLQEKRITRTGKVVEDRLSPVESLKLAAKHYPLLFGVKFDLGLGGEHGKAFLALADIRNDITHPENLEHLLAKDLFKYWIPGYTWVLSRLGDLLALCAQQVGGLGTNTRPFGDLSPYKHSEREPRVFSDQGYQTIRSGSLRTLEYVKQAFGVLMSDTRRAMALTSSSTSIDSFLGPHGQFGFRNWIRTFSSEVEGTIHIASFFISASAERGEFVLSGEDRESLDVKFLVDEKLVRLMNI